MASDPAFGMDNFNKPKILTESRTLVNNILTILFTKKGTYPSQPRLGMDIQQYLYGFDDAINIAELKSELAYQCADFLPYITDGSLDIIKTRHENNTLLVFKVPAIIKNEYQELILGVTISAKGEMVFNFTFDKENTL